MLRSIIRFATIGLALLASVAVTAPELSSTAEASSNVSAQRSRQCSQEARRYADRNMRRTTATGAAGGAAIGAIASQSRRNTGSNTWGAPEVNSATVSSPSCRIVSEDSPGIVSTAP